MKVISIEIDPRLAPALAASLNAAEGRSVWNKTDYGVDGVNTNLSPDAIRRITKNHLA